MTKQEQDELLSAYLDGQLDAAEHERLETQLADDPGLQSELDALRRTVQMVRNLPAQPIPRNFILPPSVAARSRPALAVRPRRRWAAPLLTAATSLVSLLFVAVLAGDLLLTGSVPMASNLADEQRLVAPAPVAEGIVVEEEVEKEMPADTAASPPPGTTDDSGETAPPAAAVEAAPTAGPVGSPLPSPAPTSVQKEQAADEESGADTEGQERVSETEPPLAAAGGGGTEDADTPAPASPSTPTASPPPRAFATGTMEPTPVPPIPPPPEPVQGPTPEPKYGESSTEPVEELPEARWEDEDRRPAAGSVWLSPLRILAMALGVTALGMAVITVLAWRARRR